MELNNKLSLEKRKLRNLKEDIRIILKDSKKEDTQKLNEIYHLLSVY